MVWSSIRKDVLVKIQPSTKEQQELNNVVEILVSEVASALAYKKCKAQVFVGGSAAKGTWLKGNHDIDIFVRFPKNAKDISNTVENVLELLPDSIERVHGSRDYFQFSRGNFHFEIVPVLNITNPKDAQNVTDMSPLHAVHIEKNMNKKLCDETRLVKQFAKANRCYGAESYINGFSGHVLELLILHYNGFLPLLTAAAKWKGQVVIDTLNHHKNPLQKLNTAKIQCPLVLVDPVQPERNAAAALSQEVFARFVRAAQRFVVQPTKAAFTIKKVTAEQLKKRFAKNPKAIVIEMHAKKGKADVVGTKCLKAYEYIQKHLEGFVVQKNDFFFNETENKAVCYLVVDVAQLPKTSLRQGPPITAIKDATAFTKKHAQAKHKLTTDSKRLFAYVPYTQRTLKGQVKEVVKNTFVTSRVKKTVFY